MLAPNIAVVLSSDSGGLRHVYMSCFIWGKLSCGHETLKTLIRALNAKGQGPIDILAL